MAAAKTQFAEIITRLEKLETIINGLHAETVKKIEFYALAKPVVRQPKAKAPADAAVAGPGAAPTAATFKTTPQWFTAMYIAKDPCIVGLFTEDEVKRARELPDGVINRPNLPQKDVDKKIAGDLWRVIWSKEYKTKTVSAAFKAWKEKQAKPAAIIEQKEDAAAEQPVVVATGTKKKAAAAAQPVKVIPEEEEDDEGGDSQLDDDDE